MPNPKSTRWLVTLDTIGDNWREVVINGNSRGDENLKNIVVRVKSGDHYVEQKASVVRIVATRELSDKNKDHIHIIIEFDWPVPFTKLHRHYIPAAHLKAMKQDFDNCSRTIDYIMKDKPGEDKIVFWPSKDAWSEFGQL